MDDWVWFEVDRVLDIWGATEKLLWDVGMCRSKVRAGDHIFLVGGVSVLLILRSQPGKKYQLVSPVRKMKKPMKKRYWDAEARKSYEYIDLV